MTDASDGVDEGYIKYVSHWTEGPAPDSGIVEELNHWRGLLHDAGLIGHYADLNVGFGNISVRSPNSNSRQFVISGTQTGHVEAATAKHYSLVTDVDIDANTLSCIGPVQASSEALTHAAIYSLSANIRAVVHAHSAALWGRYKDKLPTTDKTVRYGTPEMARELLRLWKASNFAECGVAVMAGHEEGLISIGATIEQAAQRMLRL